jgi:hypothetical protein
LNSIGNGLSLAFVDAAAVGAPTNVQWVDDPNSLSLVPQSARAVTLEIDTHDDACGNIPTQPCTGTWTNYDNSHVAKAGIGYRILRGNNVMYSNLMYGGRYTAVPTDLSGSISVGGVAATGSPVNAQVDYYNGQLSWYINGQTIFSNQDVELPSQFFVALAANTGGVSSQEVEITTAAAFFCTTAPAPPSG